MTLIAFHDGIENASLDTWRYHLTKSDHQISVIALSDSKANDAEIALVWNPPNGRLAELKNLKLICSLGQGVDHLWKDQKRPQSVPIIRLVDPHMSHALSQWVLAVLLDFLRDGPFYRENRLKREFNKLPQANTIAMKVAIYGIGAIGSEVAQNLQSLQFDVSGWAQTPKTERPFKQEIGKHGFERLVHSNLIHICLLPLTKNTKSLFSQDVFDQMPKGSYFINAGRGEQVDEMALLQAVRSGHLSGAALDVFCEEPLPVSHPFWNEPKISIWPHIAAQTDPATTFEQIARAIYAVKSGLTPKNLVDPDREY
ncbi:MAG: NAD(P)-dependent oxidoreductase [Alphaproteobacteria bacterium]